MKFFLIFFLCAAFLFSENNNIIKVYLGKDTFEIPVYLRQGLSYISAEQLANVISPSSKYNKETGKISFINGISRLDFSSKNPFIVLSSSKEKKTYQLPTSTYEVNGDLYIPVKYSMDILNNLFDNRLELKTEGIYIRPIKTSKLFNINDLSLDEKANGTLITLSSNKKLESYKSNFKDGILTIILNGVNADISKIKKANGKGVIKEITALNKGNSTELKLKVTKDYTASEVLSSDNGNDIIITIHNKIFTHKENKDKVKWDFDVIVLDAGHGGKDVGAIGVNGVKEKDVNLGVTLKLGKLIEKNFPNVKVVYTRDNDTFVELYKRGKIANENGGKLFISIHCNSTVQKPTDANGFEVYLLRPGRTKEAIHIAERENSVIQYEDNPARYQKLTDENFILVSMAHSSYMKYSEKFSEYLDKNMGDGLDVYSRGVKQAGFYVLVGASMPSVLIETGFLSNKKNADYLKSENGQREMASSILNAIRDYKSYYEHYMDLE